MTVRRKQRHPATDLERRRGLRSGGQRGGHGIKMGLMGGRGIEHVDYDAELRLQNEALRRAYEIDPGDRVLDVGCGAGQTTRDAARLASDGWVLGVDISEAMIERARSLAEAEALRNVTFEHADAQHHLLPAARFDLVISRFGTMFFRDPIAAFRNIGRGMRPAGRLLLMVWQGHDRNEWSVSIRRALAVTTGSPVGDPPGLDPFSLADRSTIQGVLGAAGFTDITLTDVDEPVFYGRDLDAALEWIRGFASTKQAVDRLDPPESELALERLRTTLTEHTRDDGVWFDSHAWIVRARRS
jgi:SAM-dependent methyltransferase